MDYTDFPKQLVYRERRTLEDFVEEHEENTWLIDNILDSNYFSSADGKERARRCFNTAYYLCTMILNCKKQPEWNFGKYCEIAYCGDNKNAVYQSFTLSLVYIFLTHTCYEVPCKKLLKKLHDYLHNITHALVWNDPFLKNYFYFNVCDDLQKGLPDNFLIAEEFAPRKIDRDIFREVDNSVHWTQITNYYERKSVREIVDFLGKDEEEKHVLIDLIRLDAQRYYIGNNHYHETVKPILDEMAEDIYHEYNDAVNKELFEAEIEEFQHQGDLRPLQARIAELEAQLNNPQQKTGEEELLRQQLADAQKTIEEREATIEELNETISRYQMRGLPPAKRKGIALGLTPIQAVIFGNFFAKKFGITFENKKKELSLMLNCLFGYGISSLANKMSKTTTATDDCMYLASIFGPCSPALAKEICSEWTESTLAPWVETGEMKKKDEASD